MTTMTDKGRIVLIVDDSLTMLSFLSRIFKSEYEVVDKSDAKSALDCIEEGKIPDLIITDINMPNINGIEFVKMLKEKEEYENIPIIVLSSNQESSDKICMLKMGVDDYIVKPFNAEELSARAQRVISRTYGENIVIID